MKNTRWILTRSETEIQNVTCFPSCTAFTDWVLVENWEPVFVKEHIKELGNCGKVIMPLPLEVTLTKPRQPLPLSKVSEWLNVLSQYHSQTHIFTYSISIIFSIRLKGSTLFILGRSVMYMLCAVGLFFKNRFSIWKCLFWSFC